MKVKEIFGTHSINEMQRKARTSNNNNDGQRKEFPEKIPSLSKVRSYNVFW